MSEKSNVIDFYGYKRKKLGLDRPIFSKPVRISLGNSNSFSKKGPYLVVCNLVYDDRQFLALKDEENPERPFILVEGVADNGQLKKVLPVKEDEFSIIEQQFKEVFDEAKSKYEYESKETNFRF